MMYYNVTFIMTLCYLRVIAHIFQYTSISLLINIENILTKCVLSRNTYLLLALFFAIQAIVRMLINTI